MSVTVGLVFKIKGTRIVLSPTRAAREATNAVDNLKKNGIEVELPPGIEIPLGPVSNGLQDIIRIFDPSAEMPLPENLPDVLQTAYKKMLAVDVTINDFYARIPGTEDKKGKKKFRIGIYASAPGGQPLIGTLEFDGFQVTFETEA